MTHAQKRTMRGPLSLSPSPGRQVGRLTDRQTDRQTDSQTDELITLTLEDWNPPNGYFANSKDADEMPPNTTVNQL